MSTEPTHRLAQLHALTGADGPAVLYLYADGTAEIVDANKLTWRYDPCDHNGRSVRQWVEGLRFTFNAGQPAGTTRTRLTNNGARYTLVEPGDGTAAWVEREAGEVVGSFEAHKAPPGVSLRDQVEALGYVYVTDPLPTRTVPLWNAAGVAHEMRVDDNTGAIAVYVLGTPILADSRPAAAPGLAFPGTAEYWADAHGFLLEHPAPRMVVPACDLRVSPDGLYRLTENMEGVWDDFILRGWNVADMLKYLVAEQIAQTDAQAENGYRMDLPSVSDNALDRLLAACGALDAHDMARDPKYEAIALAFVAYERSGGDE